jgi:Ca-activated chloride channel family protein
MEGRRRTQAIFWGIVGTAVTIVVIILFKIMPSKPEQPTGTPAAQVLEATATPAGPPVEILMLTADTKAEWVHVVTDPFNEARHTTSSGRPIWVNVEEQDSPGEAQQRVLDGEIKPVVWSPGDMSWIEGANQVWEDRYNRPLVSGECPRTVYAATGFAMWRPMAEALGWPDEPIGWETLVELAADPEGWGRYGHPEWGAFTFGHSHPDHSTTGFSVLATLAYGTLGLTEGLTPELVKSEAVVEAFRTVELNTYHYGTSTRKLLTLMAENGPSYLHAVTSSETATLKSNEVNAEIMRYPFVFIFPAEGTFWSDNPYCIVEESWVSDEQREAAEIYREYLLAPEQQDMAVTIGLRPAVEGVAMHDPISFEYGTDPRVSPHTIPPLAEVDGDTAAAIRDVFHATKKKATVIVLLDTSSSMSGEKIENAVAGTAVFLSALGKDDEATIYTFDSQINLLRPAGRAGEVGERLTLVLQDVEAGGSTKLYDAVCEGVGRINRQWHADEAAGERRLYGVVVLSDGDDTASDRNEQEMFSCLPSGEDVEGVKVFTIAYGKRADEELLASIAERTNGGFFAGDPESIEYVYRAIAAEQ